MKKVNVLFLDIDGVLNSPRSMLIHHLEAVNRKGSTRNQAFDPLNVRIINQVCAEFDVHVVVSSTWRGMPNIESVLHVGGLDVKFFDLQQITRDPEEKIWRPAPMGDGETYTQFHARMGTITPIDISGLGGHRGKQIDAWLQKFGQHVNEWVIIDDDSDMLDTQLPRFVHTDPENGITAQNHRQMRNLFAGKVV